MAMENRITTVADYGENEIVLENDSPDIWRIAKRGNNTFVITGFAADRLAAYEDTGLTPEEIKALQVKNAKLNKLIGEIEGTIERR